VVNRVLIVAVTIVAKESVVVVEDVEDVVKVVAKEVEDRFASAEEAVAMEATGEVKVEGEVTVADTEVTVAVVELKDEVAPDVKVEAEIADDVEAKCGAVLANETEVKEDATVAEFEEEVKSKAEVEEIVEATDEAVVEVEAVAVNRVLEETEGVVVADMDVTKPDEVNIVTVLVMLVMLVNKVDDVEVK